MKTILAVVPSRLCSGGKNQFGEFCCLGEHLSAAPVASLWLHLMTVNNPTWKVGWQVFKQRTQLNSYEIKNQPHHPESLHGKHICNSVTIIKGLETVLVVMACKGTIKRLQALCSSPVGSLSVYHRMKGVWWPTEKGQMGLPSVIQPSLQWMILGPHF